MNKKLRKIIPLFTGLVLLTAGSALTVQGENDRTIDVSLFKLNLPDNWNYDPDDISDYEYSCSASIFEGDDESSSEREISIKASEESAYSFRGYLKSYKIDVRDYADGNVEKVTYGDVEYVRSTDGSSRIYYTYRHVPSGITYRISLYGEETDSTRDVLNNLELKLEDTGNVESPYPWEGTPYEPTLQNVAVGDFTIVPEYIPFNASQAGFEIMHHQFAIAGDRMYHQLYNTLETYEYTGSTLNLLSSDTLDAQGIDLFTDTDGKLYISRSSNGIVMKDGQTILETGINGYLSVHPSGAWGLTNYLSYDTEKVTFQDDSVATEPWILTFLDDDENRTGIFRFINLIEISNDHIMVCGRLAGDDAPTKIAIYDLDGNQLLLLGGEQSGDPAHIGSITGIAETANGYVAADGNMREFYFWTKDGTLLGEVECSELFGTSYPWIEDMKVAEDGSLMLLMTQRRDDESASELMVFRLSGF